MADCKARMIKQVPLPPTVKRRTAMDGFVFPGPTRYEIPPIVGGKGFSKIKRAPAYTFRVRTPLVTVVSNIRPNAPQLDIRNMHRKGIHKIPLGKIGEQCPVIVDKLNKPGPGAYTPQNQLKRAPAYSIRQPYKPDYQPWDMWTPPPNMYLPPIMKEQRHPAYSLNSKLNKSFDNGLPGPGTYDPKHDTSEKSAPAYGFQSRIPPPKPPQTPAPNAHCEKRFMYSKRSIPAPSFGIRHSPYIGKPDVFEKPSALEMLSKDQM